MEKRARANAVIRGRVQGVFFRAETAEAAGREGVSGWVRNRPDGTVEAVFEGEESRVKAVLDWCRKGPPLSRVEEVEVSWEPFQGEFADFRIRR